MSNSTFDRSPLGAFVRSPLGARNKATPAASPVKVLYAYAGPSGLRNWDTQLAIQAIHVTTSGWQQYLNSIELCYFVYPFNDGGGTFVSGAAANVVKANAFFSTIPNLRRKIWALGNFTGGTFIRDLTGAIAHVNTGADGDIGTPTDTNSRVLFANGPLSTGMTTAGSGTYPNRVGSLVQAGGNPTTDIARYDNGESQLDFNSLISHPPGASTLEPRPVLIEINSYVVIQLNGWGMSLIGQNSEILKRNYYLIP